MFKHAAVPPDPGLGVCSQGLPSPLLGHHSVHLCQQQLYVLILKRRATVVITRVIHLNPCAVSPWCVAFSVSVGISALFLPEPHPYSHCSALPSVSCPVCSLVQAVDRLNIGTSPLGISTTHPPPLDLQTEAKHECPVQNCLVPGSSRTWGKEFLQALFHSAVTLL